MQVFIAIKGNCSAPGKIRLSERRTSLFVLPSVRILSNGEAGEGKSIILSIDKYKMGTDAVAASAPTELYKLSMVSFKGGYHSSSSQSIKPELGLELKGSWPLPSPGMLMSGFPSLFSPSVLPDNISCSASTSCMKILGEIYSFFLFIFCFFILRISFR